MAKVSSGSIVTNSSEGRSLTLNWSVNSTSVEENYKEIYWSLVGSGTASGYIYAGDFKVTIDGDEEYKSSTRIQLFNGTVVASGYKKLYHDDKGEKKFSASIEASIYWYAVTNKASGTWELPTIPRYLSITSLEVNNITETSAVCRWVTSDPRNSTYYSFDNGATWIGSATDGETLASDTKSGTFNILNLSANTTYNMKVKIKRTDSGLWTESGTVVFATYNYPHCTNSPDFTIGDTLTLDLYNPLGRQITIAGYAKTNNSVIFSGATNGARISGFNSTKGHNDLNEIASQYSSIPNSQSGAYKVVVSYGNIAMTRDAGNKYKVRGNEVPTINDFDYVDGNNTTINITKNEKHIVQNLSKLVARFVPATPNYWAGSISKYRIDCNGKFGEWSKDGSYDIGTIDSARNVDLTLTVTDSRGLTSSKTIEVAVLEHSQPTAVVTLQRLNNYEDETYITVDGSVSSVNNKNAMAIRYRYKQSGGSYGSLVEIGDREKHTLSLDKNNIYIFEVLVIDAFGSQFIKEYTLDKGVFPLFINTRLNSVGVNKFPVYDESFEANGLISLGERQTLELEVGKSVEIPVWLALYTGLVNFRMSGANLEIARLFFVFRSNQYFGTHKVLVDENYGNTGVSVPMEMRNTEQGYMFKITNNHSSTIHIRYGILELC